MSPRILGFAKQALFLRKGPKDAHPVAKHRITQKSLKKPDEFLTISQKVITFFIKHSRVFSITIGCLVLAALISVALDYYHGKRIHEASSAFASAVRLYEQNQYGRAIASFQEIASTRSSGPYRELSLLYTANSQIRLGEPGAAIKTLGPVLSSTNSFVKALGFKLKGDAEVNLGQINAAVTSYGEAAVLSGPLAGESLLLQARQLEKSGKSSEAQTLYRKFLQSFPDAQERPLVEAKLKSIIP